MTGAVRNGPFSTTVSLRDRPLQNSWEISPKSPIGGKLDAALSVGSQRAESLHELGCARNLGTLRVGAGSGPHNDSDLVDILVAPQKGHIRT